MKRFSFTVAAATTSGAAAVALAGIAAAAPTGGGNAGDATKELHGSLTDPLSTCVTTGVHGTPTTAGLPGPSFGSRPFTTIYLDVLCPDAH